MAGTSHAEWSGFGVYDPIWEVAAVNSPEQQSPAADFIGLVEAVTLATAPVRGLALLPSNADRTPPPAPGNFHELSRKNSDHDTHNDPLRLLLHR
jgi:hypothetical protein